MATHKVKSGQDGLNWKDKVIVRGDSSEEELTYNQVEEQLNQEKAWLKMNEDKIKELEDKMKKIKAVADK